MHSDVLLFSGINIAYICVPARRHLRIKKLVSAEKLFLVNKSPNHSGLTKN